LIAPSSSTSATFADCLESTLPITMETARTTRLRRRLPAVDYSRLQKALAVLSWPAGDSAASITDTTGRSSWPDRFWRATTSCRRISSARSTRFSAPPRTCAMS
jgi:hypothetical protein